MKIMNNMEKMKIRLHQLSPVVGDLDNNKDLILEVLRSAESDGVEQLVIPENCLNEDPAKDLLESERFRERCYELNRQIAEATGETALIFGTILPAVEKDSRKMHNSAILARHGEIVRVFHKTLLPTYDIFAELRYFEPNKVFETAELNGFQIGVTICEDLWQHHIEDPDHGYSVDPAPELTRGGARLIINISAPPFTNTKHDGRRRMLRYQSDKLNVQVLYCNLTGGHTDVIFDGDSAALNSRGELIAAARPFTPGHLDVIAEISSEGVELTGSPGEISAYPERGPARQFEAIVTGLKD